MHPKSWVQFKKYKAHLRMFSLMHVAHTAWLSYTYIHGGNNLRLGNVASFIINVSVSCKAVFLGCCSLTPFSHPIVVQLGEMLRMHLSYVFDLDIHLYGDCLAET